jgi:ferredoxin
MALGYTSAFLNGLNQAFRSQSSVKMSRKYDPEAFIKVSVLKPLGLFFEENVMNKPKGVHVEQAEPGNALDTGKMEPGLLLIEAAGQDVRNLGFDGVMDVMRGAPADQPLDLTFIRPNDVFKGKAIVQVVTEGGKEFTLEVPKGTRMRNALLGSGVEVYDLKGKLSNCGGGGLCGTCVVDVEIPENDDWYPKPDFESAKLKKYSETCRLSCNMEVEGDCRIIVKPSKL